MTREEAIQRLKTTDACDVDLCEALEMAIKALEKESCGDCISREAVENAIKHAEVNFTVNSDIDFTKHKREVQEIVNGIIDAQIKALRDLPSVTAQPKWIPVGEKLPPNEEKSYWICTENGYQCQCRWTNVNHIFTYLTSDWHWHIMDVPQYDKVVAWMPLPTPPNKSEIPTGAEGSDKE